jgi:hypothetical protein
MKIIFTLLMSLLLTSAFAQQSWKAVVNGKTVLTAQEENEAQNVVRLSRADIRKKKPFSLTYTVLESKDWQRTIAAYDEEDNELLKQTGKNFTLTSASVQKLFKKSKKVRIFTWSLPDDPALRQTIRIRRLHLCTLVQG